MEPVEEEKFADLCVDVQVLEAAHVVVATNDHGGIAEAFERFIL